MPGVSARLFYLCIPTNTHITSTHVWQYSEELARENLDAGFLTTRQTPLLSPFDEDSWTSAVAG